MEISIFKKMVTEISTRQFIPYTVYADSALNLCANLISMGGMAIFVPQVCKILNL